MSKPKILVRDVNSVKLSWENVFPETDAREPYVMEMYKKITDWRLVYWGYKPQCTVDKLEPCTCYNFRLKRESDEKWLNFKAASDVGPYLLMHMTRAVKFRKLPLLKKIMQSRPMLLEWENNVNKTPLMQVAESGDEEMAAILLTYGANVNTVQLSTLRTPLMIALYYGKLEVASLYVEKGADIKARDINKLTILHYAVDANRLDSVKYALELNCDVNSQDNMGFTPIIRAVFLNSSRDIIELLFENGANPNLKDRGGFDFAKHCELASRLELLMLVRKKVVVREPSTKSLVESVEQPKGKKQFVFNQSAENDDDVNDKREVEQTNAKEEIEEANC